MAGVLDRCASSISLPSPVFTLSIYERGKDAYMKRKDPDLRNTVPELDLDNSSERIMLPLISYASLLTSGSFLKARSKVRKQDVD